MRPIRDIDELATGAVLHHSAFGFARVRDVNADDVGVNWESDDANLPGQISAESLRKAYSLCDAGGFFSRALADRNGLTEELTVDPPSALRALLGELGGTQNITDLRDWVTGRKLLSVDAFDRWWKTALPLIERDAGLTLTGETLSLSSAKPNDIGARLQSPSITASSRWALAQEHRQGLPEAQFDAAAAWAWRDGSRLLRDEVLQAMSEHSAERVFSALLEGPSDPVEALIHAIRQGHWTAAATPESVQEAIFDRVLRGIRQGAPLDAEGRLAAALARWPSPYALDSLSAASGSPDGHRLLRSTMAALPHSRSTELSLELLQRAIGRSDGEAATWLAAELLERLEPDETVLRELLDKRYPHVATWLAENYQPSATLVEEGATAELDLGSLLTEAVPIARLPPQSGRGFVAVALAVARALAAAHDEGRVVNPTRQTLWFSPDGAVEFRASTPDQALRTADEGPTTQSDVYASAVLLLEFALGKPWPEAISPSLAIPYLRGAVHGLPPAAIAPLDAALHPSPACRPQDGHAWMLAWQATAQAEDERAALELDLDARLDVGYDSHVGRMKILYTQTNQDALFAAERSGVTLLAVCDGISTATAGSGDVAAGITAHVVSSLWEQALSRLRTASVPETEDFLARAFRMANQAVCEAALRFAGGRLHGRVPMGTTAVVGISRGNRITLAWLGDSRAYIVGPYGASLLTADMNQAGDRMVGWARGDLSHWDPNGYALVGYVGHFDESYTAIPLQPAIIDIKLLPNERLVICSDGVTDYASPNHPETANRIARAVLARPCDEAARALVELANRGGGGDNATAVVTTLRRT
ncbi:MAG: protein phosphatase 2C domain-containing protein [Proteobacteria bacterium]|nr:protein phosphatase 2C domain-containing protein [Pseudomonadota bacterium]